MERTSKINAKPDNPISTPEKIRWQKIGGGSLRLTIDGKKHIIKPNEKFKAGLNEVPQAFRDRIIPLDDLPGKAPAPVITGVETVYVLKQRGKGGWYDVVDLNGKVLNEKALKKEVAEKLVQDLAK